MVQIAVSVVLLAGAGLLTRTMIRLSNVDTGLVTEDVLTMRLTLLIGAELRDSNAVATATQRCQSSGNGSMRPTLRGRHCNDWHVRFAAFGRR